MSKQGEHNARIGAMGVGIEEVVTTRRRRVAAFQDSETGKIVNGRAAGRRRESKAIALVAGPGEYTSRLPLSGRELDKFRGPKEFTDAARQYLDPEEVGPVFAAAFMESMRTLNHRMFSSMAPYVFGVVSKDGMGGGDGVMDEVLTALLTPKGRPRGSRRMKVIDGVIEEEKEEETDE